MSSGRNVGRGAAWSVVLVVLVVVAVVGWVLGARSQSPEQAAAAAAPPEASWVTATVERRVLSATVIQRGDVAPEIAVSVGVPVSVEGGGVVTQVVVSAGDVVVDGARVVEVSGRPVFVFEGDVPVYRSLRPTMSGADVGQLQAALVRLGFAPDTDGVFGEATKSAVTALYEQAGYTPVPSSLTASVDTAAARQAVAAADRGVEDANARVAELAGGSVAAVTQAQVALDQARRAASDAVASRASSVALGEGEYNAAVRERDRLRTDPDADAAARDAAQLAMDQAGVRLDDLRRDSEDQVISANEAVLLAEIALDEVLAGGDVGAAERDVAIAGEVKVQADAALAAVLASVGPTVPQGEVVFVPSMPARVLSAAATPGAAAGGANGGAGSGGAADGSGQVAAAGVVELAAGRLVVSTVIRPGDVALVRAGMLAELLDETTSTVYEATIAQVAAEPTVGADGQLGHPATIVPATDLPDGLTGANLRVTVTAASTETDALVVPLAAVSSAADGVTRVSVVDGPNGTPVDVEVIAGLSADGFVAVEPVNPNELAEGDLVVVGK